MCVAVPVRVEELLEAGMLRCRAGQSDTFVVVSDALLEEPAQSGDYLIVHAGFALRRLEVEEAEETLRLLRSLAEFADNRTGPA
ncbi:MAG: HypC/HybG/HupF family hydrogenase formation chaperone [Deltaproteobacteria bacterium]|jgi:hydrogenase expression/formation protein HypC|nr:HypC/HybG/HupF family hydrogenase formation chaperone [Deltaproteobacteria bacterium]